MGEQTDQLGPSRQPPTFFFSPAYHIQLHQQYKRVKLGVVTVFDVKVQWERRSFVGIPWIMVLPLSSPKPASQREGVVGPYVFCTPVIPKLSKKPEAPIHAAVRKSSVIQLTSTYKVMVRIHRLRLGA